MARGSLSRSWKWLLWLCLVFLSSRSVEAQTVGLVRPAAADRILTETATRLHGELAAVGFEVKWLSEPATGAESEQGIQPWIGAFRGVPLDAVLSLVEDAEVAVVNVWTLDAEQQVHLVRVAQSGATVDVPSQLAIHAVEVVRSELLDLGLISPQESPSSEPDLPPTKTSPVAPPQPAPTAAAFQTTDEAPADRSQGAVGESIGFGAAAGLTATSSLAGVGPAVMPLVRLDLTVLPTLTIGIWAAGLGTTPTVAADGSSARVTQTSAMLGARYRFGVGQSLRPFIGVGGGALATVVAGRAEAPHVSNETREMSLLMEASSGAELGFFQHGYVSLSGHVQVAEPSVAIHILDNVVATTGSPNVGINLCVGVWL